MADSQVHNLERLYLGTLVDEKRGNSSTPGIIARTPRITQAHAAECLHMARLAPPAPNQRSEDMPGAFGLFRGKSADFILTKAQYNLTGYPQILHILVPMAPLRELGGNVLSFRSLAMMDMPSFLTVKDNLLPYEMRDPAPLSDEEQIRSLQDLLLYCQDSFKYVEEILSALVQGWPIAIVNSPASLDQRLRFIQGLLSLLPLPARVGITFATHTTDIEAIQAQIKFTNEMVQPPDHLIFDWNGGNLLASVPKHSYSRYIIAQLKLDPQVVVAQTDQLSRTAVWRARHKEDLGSALAWVSRRAAIDRTVADGQPADRATVAAILREDPTLPPKMRLAYARHLLAFALALNEPDSADVIPQVAASNPDIARTISEQLTQAIGNGHAAIVFEILERWLLRVPEGSASQWQPILHSAARQHTQDLLDANKITPTIKFIHRIQTAHAALHLEDVVPVIVNTAHHAARKHPKLAHLLFVISIESLPLGQFQRLLNDEQFASQLPEGIRTTLRYLQPTPIHPAPPHVLAGSAQGFDGQMRLLLIARMVEWAIFLNRPQLIDTEALEALLALTQTRYANRFDTLIEHVLEDFSEQTLIRILEPPGPRILVQLMLVTGRFNQAVSTLEFYQNVVFRPENIKQFTQISGEAFRLTPMPPENLTQALASLEGSQIRPVPRAMIYCSALINRKWTDDQHYAARRLTSMIFSDSALISTLGMDNIFALLRFHEQRHNALDALRVGAALVDYTLAQPKQQSSLLVKMWPHISWNEEVRAAALELLRRFLRGIPEDEVGEQITYLRRSLGAEVGDMLTATHIMRQVLGKASLLEYSQALRLATQLLIDLSTPYHTNKELPPQHRLRRDLDTMTGGLSDAERDQVAQNAFGITRQVYELGAARSRKRKEPDRSMRLLNESCTPDNGIELLLFMGGHFGGHQVSPLDLNREEMAHIFGNRSAAMFLRETSTLTQLLDGLQKAFPTDETPVVSPKALTAELNSLWDGLSLFNQRQIQERFSEDLQQLGEVIALLSSQVNERVFADSGLGLQLETGERQPRTSLEAMRWIHGYFSRRHNRNRS